MLRRWLALVALVVAGCVGTSMAISAWSSHPAVRPVSQPGPLVIVSMPTLTWTDLSATRTPALWSLALRGAVAAQATRDLSDHSCPDQSWLAFSAGGPTDIGNAVGATSPGQSPGACAAPVAPRTTPDGSAFFTDWGAWRRQSNRRGTPADIGLVGTALSGAGQCVAAAGQYAALGAADRDGVVSHYTENPEQVDLNTCAVTLIGLAGPDDAYLARLVRRLPVGATLVVTGLADGSKSETLHAVVMAGPGVPHGLLTSLSTRQPGFLQTTDLTALVLARLGTGAPTLNIGRSPVVRPVAGTTGPIVKVTGLTTALNIEHPFVPRFFVLFLGGAALASTIGLVWWLIRRGIRKRAGPRRKLPVLRLWFAIAGAMCAAMPMSTFLVGLVPWWRSGHPEVTLSLAIIGVSAALTALALLGPWRRWVAGPMTFLIALTLFVIAQDVVHGSRLQFISLMGLQPVYGGRYFGQGNVAYAVFATTALLLAAILAGRLIEAGHPRFATATVVLIGLAAVVIDGSPSWGADGGGPAAMMPAFAYLTLNAAGLSLTWRRLAVIVGSTVTVVGAFAVLDYLRPKPYRTHLGDFVAQLLDTGQLSGLARIWTENWAMLTSTWLNMAVALLLLVTLLALVMPRLLGRPLQPLLARVPFLGQGLAAVAVCWLLGFVSNDSGTAIPPTGLLVVIPLMILLAAWVRQTPQTETAPPLPADGGPVGRRSGVDTLGVVSARRISEAGRTVSSRNARPVRAESGSRPRSR